MRQSLAPRQCLVALVFVLGGFVAAQPAITFKLIEPGDPYARVTGIYCASATACLVSSEGSTGHGHVFATDGNTITAELMPAGRDLAAELGVLGVVDFVGFSAAGGKVIALVAGSGAAFVHAEGDITDPAAWTVSTLGSPEDGSSFGGNQQIGFGIKDGWWTYFRRSTFFQTPDDPSPSARWEAVWAPTPPGEIPGNLMQLVRQDPSLCQADPAVGVSPRLLQPGYIAADLALIVYPAGSRNQMGSAGPGVCLSLDGGQRFHHVAFAEVPDSLGPLGVACLGPDRCVAYGGIQNEPESTYIYFTANASQGVGSTWTRATLPRLREDSRFRAAAFAPDGQTVWIVGASGAATPLVMVSADGGATWTDASSLVRDLAPDARFHTVHVTPEGKVWIGGEDGVLLAGGY